jgi:hypothetical protein
MAMENNHTRSRPPDLPPGGCFAPYIPSATAVCILPGSFCPSYFKAERALRAFLQLAHCLIFFPDFKNKIYFHTLKSVAHVKQHPLP